jgi:hypothetical protein
MRLAASHPSAAYMPTRNGALEPEPGVRLCPREVRPPPPPTHTPAPLTPGPAHRPLRTCAPTPSGI